MEVLNHYTVFLKLILHWILINWNLKKNLKKKKECALHLSFVGVLWEYSKNIIGKIFNVALKYRYLADVGGQRHHHHLACPFVTSFLKRRHTFIVHYWFSYLTNTGTMTPGRLKTLLKTHGIVSVVDKTKTQGSQVPVHTLFQELSNVLERCIQPRKSWLLPVGRY